MTVFCETTTGLQTYLGLRRTLHAMLLGSATLATGVSAAVIWTDTETVATSTQLSLAFNNTNIAVGDGDGGLHLVWQDASNLRYGHQVEAGSWMTQTLAPAGSGAVIKPTITSVGGETLLVGWAEQVKFNQQRGAFTTSDDFGTNWSTPSWLSPPASMHGL